MLEEKETVVAETNEGENPETPEVGEVVKEAVKNYVHDKTIEKAEQTEEDARILQEMLDEANMPVEYTDEEFKLGPQELDIRKLNKRNQAQLQFRMASLQAVYLRNISKSLLDITNLLFVLLDKLGVEDIISTSDEVLDKIAEENERLQKVAKELKNKKD